MKLVIVGLGTAGFAAALAARKTDRNCSITIIDEKSYDLMHPCGLPFYLEGRIKNIENLKHHLNLKQMNIEKVKDKAIGIDTKNKEVITENNKKIKYDKLVIATGASPFVPPIEGKELAYVVDSLESAEKIKKAAKKGKKACVIGAGAIGLETAFALNENGLDVSVADMLPSSFPRAIDPDMSAIIEEYLTNKKIRLLFNEKIKKIEKNKVITENKEIDADIVVLATGVKANIETAKKAGLKATEFGITINEKMQTSNKDVYSAGDCVQVNSLINNKPFAAQIATTAYKQGTIAGTNAVGGNLIYKGNLGTFVSVIGELEIAATGFNEFFAEQNGYNIVSAKAKSLTKPDWFPGGKEITVKILADKKTGKIIGGQAIGEGASHRINVLSAAIKAGFTLGDLSDLELVYCPGVSQHYDVLVMAADLGLRKLGK